MRSPVAALAGVALLAALTLAGCGGDDSPASAGESSPATTGPTDAGSGSASGGTCAYPSDGRSPAKQVDAPPAEPSVSGKVPALISTNVGDIAVTLDAGHAPCTVNSFVSLAGQGYFDKTPCHRLTTDGIF